MKTVLIAFLAAATSATDLKLDWTDCGDASTHGKITSFTPNTLTLGKTTTMTGTGDVDEDVSGAVFDLEMKTAIGTIPCKGDASKSKTCQLPLGTGSLTFNALTFPIKKGTVSVSTDISLSSFLPGSLANTETQLTATASNGDAIFCINIKTSPMRLV